MKRMTISLTDHQFQKLDDLAKAKTQEVGGLVIYTVERCIQDFAESCVPEGSGWKHPATKGDAKP